jgi:hypothetical protein
MKRILRFLFAFIKFIFLGKEVTPEIYKSRTSICNECPFKKNGRCTICTCYTDMKAKWSTEHCPKNKW